MCQEGKHTKNNYMEDIVWKTCLIFSLSSVIVILVVNSLQEMVMCYNRIVSLTWVIAAKKGPFTTITGFEKHKRSLSSQGKLTNVI